MYAISFSLVRLLGIGGAAWWVLASPNGGTQTDMYLKAALFAHASVQLFSVKPSLAGKALSPIGITLLLAAFAIALTLFSYEIAFFFAFGLHAIFSDVYTVGRSAEVFERFRRLDVGLRLAFTTLLYYIIAAFDEPLTWELIPIVTPTLIGLLLACYLTIMALRLFASTKVNWDYVAYETIGLSALYFCGPHSLDVMVIAMYHIVMWVFLPMRSLPRPKYVKVLGYSAALVLIFFFVLPDIHSTSYGDQVFWQWSYMVSYMHIAITLVISRQQPTWIRQLFTADA
ncbi:MAG: hypothetical protein AAB250_02710 [Bdellovibrionota bacterium]